jgi:hypothetical protein
VIAALFVRADSVYKRMPNVDAWDIERNALNWPGGTPVVAHPPCRAWGRLRQWANPRPGEKELALRAVEWVRKHGGVLEHPEGSQLWAEAKLPAPGVRDEFGGYTLPVDQSWWGHKARKRTLLYVVGCEPKNLPDIPLDFREPTHCIHRTKRDRIWKPEVTKAEREHSPQAFAEWLVEVARRTQKEGGE